MYKIYLIAFVIILNLGCKKHHKCNDASNPDCPNYDPCFGKSTIDTAFLVLQPYGGFPPPSDECLMPSYDTVYDGANSIRLEAPKNNSSSSTYSWTIGTDPKVYKTRAFEIDLSSWLTAGNWEKSIEVRCTIKTPPNGCIKLSDTLVVCNRKVFFTKQQPLYGVFYGKFLGSNNEDTFKLINVKGYDNFRGSHVAFEQIFFIGAPFQDSFTTIPIVDYDKTCKTRSFSKYPPTLASGYVNSYAFDVIYMGRVKFTFWVQKPGEAEQVYEFVGNKIY